MDFSDFFPVWNDLKETERRLLTSAATELNVFKGAVISDGKDACSGIMLIESGQIRAYTTSPEGKEITLYRLLERDICLFSASCMMNGINFDVTLAAEKDCRVVLIPSDAYKHVMSESAPLANFTNEVLASRFSDVMWLIEQIMWKSFDKRLAAFLTEESAIEESDTLHITHEIIGNHLGSPREVVTRMLKYFAAEGLVELARGSIRITDLKRLAALS